MGGSSKQNDPKVAASSSAAADAEAQANAKLANQFAAQQSQQYNNLFGADGKSGSMGKFLDPNSLNVSRPTGAYGLQYNQARGQLATAMSQARGSLNSNLQQRGFGANSPSGIYSDNARQLALGQAQASGQLFSDYTNQSYQDALRNFWGAAGIASGADTSAMQAALQGNSSAAQTYANLYGTAAQRYTEPGLGSSILGAIGTIGGAAVSKMTLCPMKGSLITMADGKKKPAEALQQGDEVLGFNAELCTMEDDPIEDEMRCVEISFNDGHVAKCSWNSPFLVLEGGHVLAEESLGKVIVTDAGSSQVTHVRDLGMQTVVHLPLDGGHNYYADGVLHLS